ncbi:MAG TPA: hypothetical protein PKH39_08510 [Woeseiaceae bacterium]|nr:hypothetical protein [Woeseiaceae bacterium]
MKYPKLALSTAVAGAILSGGALAMPGFTEQAPFSSVEICIGKISKAANYENARRVRHEVDSEARRVGGHTIRIDTSVFGADGSELIREYSTVCAVSTNQETRHFVIREKGI